MKKISLFTALQLCFIPLTFAGNNCFIAQEKNKIIKEDGNCAARHAPCSTFKIPLSIMGFNEHLLIDATHPQLDYKPGYADWVEVWKQPHNPTTWIKNSCVWYSQILTQKMGMAKFKSYVEQFNYGNQDVSGDKGKNNGLTFSWLSSSLKLSPQEQLIFLEKLFANKLPASQQSQEQTRKLLFVETLPTGWKLYGKTGSGSQLKADGSRDENKPIGWFVGWVEKQGQHISFAQYIETQEKTNEPISKHAKELAIKQMIQLTEVKK